MAKNSRSSEIDIYSSYPRIMSHLIKDKKEFIKILRTNTKFKNFKVSFLLTDKSSKRKHLNLQVQL
jgi:hypothetical protein